MTFVKFTAISLIPASLVAIALSSAAIPTAARAQAWTPSRNVEVIVGTDPGGAQDRIARQLHQMVEKNKLIPTTITVVNKPGAAQATAIAYMNTHRADPHYLTLASSSWQNTAIINNNTETLNDVTPVIKVFNTVSTHWVRTESTIKNAQDVAGRLKQDPGAVTFTMSAAPGSQNWLTVVQFAQLAGVDPRKLRIGINSVGSESTSQVLGGHADIAVGGLEMAFPLQESGKARIIGLLTPERLNGTKAAAVPTMREQGINAVSNNWYAIVGPKGMTNEQAAYWEQVFRKAAETEDSKRFAADGFMSRDLIGLKEFQTFLTDNEKEQRATMTALGLITSK